MILQNEHKKTNNTLQIFFYKQVINLNITHGALHLGSMILFAVNIAFCDVNKCSSTAKYRVYTTYQMT